MQEYLLTMVVGLAWLVAEVRLALLQRAVCRRCSSEVRSGTSRVKTRNGVSVGARGSADQSSAPLEEPVVSPGEVVAARAAFRNLME